MTTYLILIAGFAFLIKGADYLVTGGSSLARHFKISDLVVGLTIIAIGTSAPELMINIMASATGSTDIAIGNILGSNIANIFLVLGLTAMIYPLRVKHDTIWTEIPLSLLSIMVLGFMVNDFIIDNGDVSELSRIDGFILISLFLIFIYHIYSVARTSRAEIKQIEEKIEPRYRLWSSLGLLALGILGLMIGGQMTVDSAVALAVDWGVSQSLIALTVVAIGTSLPELVTAAVAAYRKNPDIAVGSIMGSNVLNIFWVLGLSSVIREIPFNISNNMDIIILFGATILLLVWTLSGRKDVLERWQGGFFLFLYLAYIVTLIIRG